MPEQNTTPSPEPELANAADAYVVVSNRPQAYLWGGGGLIYDVPGECEQAAYTSLHAAVQHLVYVHRNHYGEEDARLYRLVPVEPDDYAQIYEMEIEAEKADQAAAEEPDFWDSRE